MTYRFLSLSAVLSATLLIAIISSSTANSQGGVKNTVILQAVTPGIAQSGHINVSGAVRGGAFAGSGLGLTGLNANNLAVGTVPDARLSVGGDLTGPLSAATVSKLQGRLVDPANPSPGDVLRWSGSDWQPGGDGIQLPYLGTTGTTNPVTFRLLHTMTTGLFTVFQSETWSNNGTAIHAIGKTGVKSNSVDGKAFHAEVTGTGAGNALYATGTGTGTLFYGEQNGTGIAMELRTQGESANGLVVRCLNALGNAVAVSGSSNSPDGVGIKGSNGGAGAGTGIGVDGFSAKNSGIGVFGGTATGSDNSIGVYGSGRGNNSTGVQGVAEFGTGTSYGGRFSSTSSLGYGLRAEASATTGATFGGYFITQSPTGTGVYSRAASTSAGSGKAFHGVISGSDMTLFKGDMTSISGSSTQYGVDITANVLNGAGIRMLNGTAGTGGTFYGLDLLTRSENGAGARILSFGSNAPVFVGEHIGFDGEGLQMTSDLRAVYAESTKSNHTNIYAIHGILRNRDGAAVYGFASSIESGINYITRGVYGEAAGPQGRGVVGQATSNTGETYGGRFTSQSSDGTGLYAAALNNQGNTYGVYSEVESRDGIAVYGKSNSQNVNSTAVGVYGADPNFSVNSYGLFSSGAIGASIKSFVIDHPLDPANKTLKHFCAEGPEPYNVYKGTVRTDAKGYATVDLPDYYEALNKDGTVTLTVVDDGDSEDFVMAKVLGGGIVQGTFRVRTSAPNTKIHWRVDAVRNDAYVQTHQPVAEFAKPDQWRGKYYSPEAFGQPAQRGIYYRNVKGGPEPSHNGGQLPKRAK